MIFHSDKTANLPFFFRQERIRLAILSRPFWEAADQNLDQNIEKEFSRVLLFNQFVKEQAEKYQIPLIKYQDNGAHFKQTLKYLN